MTNFRITVTSDTVCPWCYVGRRQLQRAQQLWLQKHPDGGDTFSVTYAPYQLQPQWPRGPAASIDKQQFYEERFGLERTEMMHRRLLQVGQQTGIDFKFGGRVGSSRDSHRLVQLAKTHGNEVELKTIDALFAAYFEHERDITAYETLRDVAVKAGIPADEFQRAIIDSDAGGPEVDKAAEAARQGGINGVPDYQVQGRFRLNGARDPTEFVRVFEKVKALERGGQVSDEE
ncbi:hypothetical protein TOPH_05985 [Tolypocladium ophioglossoides CBS 100239]|uniref:DSBA-like thioredoxin domain-containing protein n=1 Tax=Tolypocladium ophioglossoides (strain CBS 100239) TaxID=1163406 RepID=A0A0L0N5R9_TOLOC|nr:hypothetical protein TOPH_05985 [Tolypocladium ophioglossoides CBS 100239]